MEGKGKTGMVWMKSNSEIVNQAYNRVLEKLNLSNITCDKFAILRIYTLLHCMLGGDLELMQHWLTTHNKHLGYVPVDKLNKDYEYIENYLQSLI